MKNLFTLIIVIVLLVVGYKILFQKPKAEKTAAAVTTNTEQTVSIPEKTAAVESRTAEVKKAATPADEAVDLPKLKAVGQRDQAGKITRKRLDSIGNRINKLYDKHNKVNATGL